MMNDIFIGLGFLVTIWVVRIIRSMVQNYIVVNKYKSFIEIFKVHYNNAYDIVYQNHILTYSSEGVHPSKEEMETAKRNFVKLSRSLMGPRVVNQGIMFYGNDDAFTENILLYFQLKVANDELIDIARKHSTPTPPQQGDQ